jgi:hypothetical protein
MKKSTNILLQGIKESLCTWSLLMFINKEMHLDNRDFKLLYNLIFRNTTIKNFDKFALKFTWKCQDWG